MSWSNNGGSSGSGSGDCHRLKRTSSIWNRIMFILFMGQLWTTSGVLASFNLFMDRHEAQKLLGLPSDIYYVREGVVNEYALNFVVKVPAAVEHLQFAWQSFSKRPIQYEMVIEFTDFFALLTPSSNISNSGRVPQKLESFRITLPCSGRINSEVLINIRFNFYLKHFKGTTTTTNSSITTKGALNSHGGGHSHVNNTTINLKRNKICLLQEFIPSVDETLTTITKPPSLSPFDAKSVGNGKSNTDGNGNGHSNGKDKDNGKGKDKDKDSGKENSSGSPVSVSNGGSTSTSSTSTFGSSFNIKPNSNSKSNSNLNSGTSSSSDSSSRSVSSPTGSGTLSSSPAGSGSSSSSSTVAVSNSTLLLFQDPTPSLLLAGLLGGCLVTASIVFLVFFICLRRKLVPSPTSSPLSSAYSGGGIINSDPNSSSNNSSPACLLRQSNGMGMGMGMGIGESKWAKENCCDSSTAAFKDKYSNPNSTIGSRNSYVASFWNDLFGTPQHQQNQNQQQLHSCNTSPHPNSNMSLSLNQAGQRTVSSNNNSGSRTHTHHGSQGGHSHSYGPNPQMLHRYPSHLPNYHSTNNHNPHSTFNHNHGSSTNSSSMIKGSDVSPYAYAHIVPKIEPPIPPLIEWYSESTCANGGHVFTNNLYTFQPNSSPNPNIVPLAHQQHQYAQENPSPAHMAMAMSVPINQSALPPLPLQLPPPQSQSQNQSQSQSLQNNSSSKKENDGMATNASSSTRSAGSGSLIQIDGFQCRKTLIKDGHIVERFL